MADEKMQNENKKSLNTREDNVAEDIRREAAGKDAEMAADKTTEKEGAPKKTSGTGTSGTEPGSSKR